MVETFEDGSVGVLRLARPSRANAYDAATLEALLAGARALAERSRLIVIEAAGEGAFCGGADLRELSSTTPIAAADLRSSRVFTAIARLPVITIAAVHGPAVAGGCELALACDLRMVGPRARFSLPETSIGLIPSAGGTTRLARLVGVSRAKGIVLAGGELSAQEALSCGLAHRYAEDPRAEARAWAHALSARDPVALALAKEILDGGESEGSLATERAAEGILYARRRGSA
jgi:enoyl-CoA hydratase